MELTTEEIALINDHRRHKAEAIARDKQTLHLLQTAASFLQWLQDNGRGPSFTTFLDEYGYQGDSGRWSPGDFYRRIIDLIDLAEK